MRRYMATGILRPTAEAAIWSACHEAPKRKLALAQLVEAGLLTQLQIGELARTILRADKRAQVTG